MDRFRYIKKNDDKYSLTFEEREILEYDFDIEIEGFYVVASLTEEEWELINKTSALLDKTDNRPKAPWKDFKGNDLYEGDIIQHPSGQKGKIVFHSEMPDQWYVNYGDSDYKSRLCLQIGIKGQAEKILLNQKKLKTTEIKLKGTTLKLK